MIQGEVQLLTLARTQGLQAGLVPQSVLSGLHHQRQTAVDVFLALLLHYQTQDSSGAAHVAKHKPAGASLIKHLTVFLVAATILTIKSSFSACVCNHTAHVSCCCEGSHTKKCC